MKFRRTLLPSLARPLEGHRCLLVADESAPTPGLCRLMEQRCQSGPCEMHVLVSRLRRPVLVSDPAMASPRDRADEIRVDDGIYDVAEARLDSFMRALGDLGQPLTGEILAGNFRRQVRQYLKLDHYDEVVVMPSSRRRWPWPGRDIVDSIRRTCRVPVTEVMPDEVPA
jgi:hypothetical protein